MFILVAIMLRMHPSDYTVNYAIVIIVFTNINVTNSKLKNVVAE